MKYMDKYAELVVRTGLNVQQNQRVIISGAIELAEFVRLCAVKAYEAGAKEVVINWKDEKSDRIFYDMASDEVFDEVKPWRVAFFNDYAEEDAAFLSILSEDPDNLKGVEPTKISRVQKAAAGPMKPWRNKLMSNRCAWCVVSMPTEAWAVKVFPDLSPEAAKEKLWESIVKATRCDLEDPVQAWANHQAALDRWLKVLNDNQFKTFRYSNSLGTDFTIDLPNNHVWYGGADAHTDMGYKFTANMPTEEVFTMPHRNGANGKVYASYPLVYNGVRIEGMWFEFRDGLVVDYGADENLETLEVLLAIDEGAKRLGELALVPYDSPISNQKILFYETLFDENAACHLALGEAYPICIQGGEDMSDEELLEAGGNKSDTHVDFMIGTKDLEIVGIKEDGTEMAIFSKGNFAF